MQKLRNTFLKTDEIAKSQILRPLLYFLGPCYKGYFKSIAEYILAHKY